MSKSTQEIAQGLVQLAQPATGATANEDTSNTDVETSAEEQDTTLFDEASDDGADDVDTDDSNDDGDDDYSPTDGEEEASDDDADEPKGPQTLDVSDDDLVEVVVDGEVQTYTLGQLKEAASGEGAVQKRIKEAAELRKEADSHRTTSNDVVQKQRAVLTGVIQKIDQLLFSQERPQVDTSLKATNPQKYLMQVAEAEEHDRNIKNGREQLQGLVQELSEGLNSSLADFRKKESAALIKKLPILGDPERGKQRAQMVMDEATNYYGFQPDELKLVADSRFLHVLHDAAMYRKGHKTADTAKPKQKQQPKSQGKMLRTGNSKKASDAAKEAQAAKQRARDKARKSGKVSDIAQGLIVQKPRARRS